MLKLNIVLASLVLGVVLPGHASSAVVNPVTASVMAAQTNFEIRQQIDKAITDIKMGKDMGIRMDHLIGPAIEKIRTLSPQEVNFLSESPLLSSAFGTLLSYAAYQDVREIAQALLEKGARIDISKAGDFSFGNALHASLRWQGRSGDMLPLLLEMAPMDQKSAAVNGVNFLEQTPLHMASSALDKRAVRLLLKNRPNVNLVDREKKTALDRAHEALAKLRSELGAAPRSADASAAREDNRDNAAKLNVAEESAKRIIERLTKAGGKTFAQLNTAPAASGSIFSSFFGGKK